MTKQFTKYFTQYITFILFTISYSGLDDGLIVGWDMYTGVGPLACEDTLKKHFNIKPMIKKIKIF